MSIARAALVAAALAATCSPAARAADRALITRFGDGGPEALAMDGSRVAALDGVRACGTRIRIVNVVTGSIARICGGGSPLNEEGGGPALALAGRDVLVSVADDGNFHYPAILAGAPGHRLRAVVDYSDEGGDHDTGPFLGSVVGSGGARVWTEWYRTWLPVGCDPVEDACTLSPPSGTVSALPGPRAVHASGGRPEQMEGDRIALIVPGGGGASVLALDGTVLADIPAADARSAAVVGERLVTLRRGASRIDVWNATTGAPVRTIALRPGAVGRIDAARVRGELWVVYHTARAVRALRVRDGRDVLVHRHRLGAVLDAQIESPGVTWTWRLEHPHARASAQLRFATVPDPA